MPEVSNTVVASRAESGEGEGGGAQTGGQANNKNRILEYDRASYIWACTDLSRVPEGEGGKSGGFLGGRWLDRYLYSLTDLPT